MLHRILVSSYMKPIRLNIAVIGLGKIGLPLAVQFSGKGFTVTGVDLNSDLVDKVNAGQIPFPGETDLPALLEVALSEFGFSATTDSRSAVRSADIVVVVVPLVVDRSGAPDFKALDSATTAIAANLQPDTLICYETTVPVGSTRNRFAVQLEEGSGLKVGSDFNLVYSPERVFSGRVFSDLRRYPKLVGGVTPICGARGQSFYESVLEFDVRMDLARPNGVWNLGSSETAEMVKLAETTYRDVNIALANQFAKFAHQNNIDISSVIEASNSQPFSHIHKPGIAVGGHCIPVYPHLYLWNDPDAEIVRVARQTNLDMTEHYVNLLEAKHGPLDGETVLILGASYRGNVKETSFSGVFEVLRQLVNRGAKCWISDPYFSSDELRDLGLPTGGNKNDVSAIVIQADHREYENLDLSVFPKLKTIINGRSSPIWRTL